MNRPSLRRGEHRGPEGKESTLGGAHRVDLATLLFRIQKDALSVPALPNTGATLQGDDRGGEKGFPGESEIVRYGFPLLRGEPDGSGLPSAAPSAAEALKE
jgi:hypothetical protein